VIAVAADPSRDITVLSDRANIVQVWKGGVAQKPVREASAAEARA
jgi:hypothetical protein